MILTVSGFISDLMSMYPSAFTAKNQGAWSDRYTSALNGVKGVIDFKRLWRIYEDEYQSVATPPSPKWIKDAARRAVISDSVGDMSSANTITCVINGEIYEFVTSGASDKAIQRKINRSTLYWQGGYNDCPKDLKDDLKKILAVGYSRTTGFELGSVNE